MAQESKRGRPARPVSVNGIRYPSASAAGVAIGVCGETIRQRLTNKVSGYRYASEVTEIQPEPTVKRKGGRAPRPVLVRGTYYPSVASAATALGEAPHTIRYRLENGGKLYRYAKPWELSTAPKPTAAPPAAATASKVAKPCVRRRVIADGNGWFTVA
jgi:hypothetical protein